MKLYDAGILVICIVIGAIVVGGFSAKFLKPDSFPEELAEDILEIETGKEIDFSKPEPVK